MIGGISGVGSFGMGSVGSFYQSRLTENIRNARNARQAGQGPIPAAVQKPASPETPVQAVSAVRPVSREEVSIPQLTARLENDAAAMAGRMRTKYGSVGRDGVFVETGKEGLSPVDGARKNALEGQLFQVEDALAKNDPAGMKNALNDGAPALPGQEENGEAVPGMPGQKEDGEEIPGLPGRDQGGGKKIPSARETAEEGECQTCERRKYQDGSDDPGVSFKTPTNIKPEQAASAVRGHEMEHVVREQAQAKREGREVVSQTVTMHTDICPECGKAYVSGGTTETVTRAAQDQGAALEEQQQDNAAQNEEKPLEAVPA